MKNKWFFVFAALIVVQFLWSDIWIDYIWMSTAHQVRMDEATLLLAAKFGTMDKVIESLLKALLSAVGLKILYDTLKKMDDIADALKNKTMMFL